MPDPQRPRQRAALAFVFGAILSLIAGFGGIAAALGMWLAQPAFALAVRWWRGTGPAPAESGPAALRRDGLDLLALWGIALAVGALLLAWPLSALRQGGTLGAALGVSAMAGICTIGLWRLWPLWHALERDGGGLSRHWRGLADRDASPTRGAVLALCVAAVLAATLLLAWPGLLPPPARWALAIAGAGLWPVAHWVLQRLAPAAQLPIAVVEMPGPAAAVADDVPEGDLDAALYAAARGGRVDRALELLDLGADPHGLPAPEQRDQRSLPVLAAVLPDLRLLRALIAQGVDLNAPHAGLTPLLAATRDSWHGRPEAVMTLLANGADPRATDADGNSPLHHAARSSDPGVAALLRDAAAELDAINADGLTPLGVACSVGNWRLARFLLERGAHADSGTGTPALLAAAGGEEDDVAGVQLLLKHKAKSAARDRNGRNALHEAAFAGHAEIAAALLAAGADVQARDAQGRTPLLDAARGGRLATLEALVAAQSDIAAVDGKDRGALALACLAETPSPPLVRRLLELGADPQAADADGKRPVDHAAAAGRWSLVALLDPDYALPASILPEAGATEVPDRAPLSLLRDSLRAGRYDNLDGLLPLLDPQELGGLLLDEQAPLSAERIDWLLAHGADPEVRDGFADSAVFRLLARGPDAVDALQAMLRRNVSPAGAGGLARFLAACARSEQAGRGLEQLALELLERGADPFAAAEAGDPPLALAVRLGWTRLMDRLIAAGVDLDARDSHGMTALHLCAALGREAALKTLVRHGATPDMRAADGQTPLGVALSGGRRDLADWLDWRGWTLPGRALQAVDLPAAAIVGDADALRRLLDLGFEVDTPDSQGCTALLRAAGGGHRAAVDLLLAHGADPQRAAHTGATPLSAAVSMRQGEIVDRLLEAGARLEQRLPGEVTVLMLAAALGLPDLCARLLTAGANVHATDAQGLGPLHCAALYGFTCRDRPRLLALLDTLLLAGAEVDAPAAGGVTPLLLLLGARAEPGTACDEEVVLEALDHLLDEEVTLEAQDPRGFGPLHLAALHGLLQLTRRLLRAGADPDLRDALNRTPREIAVMRGFVDVAAELAPTQTQPGVSMARFLREPR
ncbi:ankyrin repeat domain-containing protein [Luteimonas sp. R10]|uniref:ankyrin repeat domain-containing protein n=1 Tax=Luteimonas sp. R10 TaxID=3108176 RepID=UPI0030911782|nr:ankyrin repeat domain-containing protein [Luteimonas sp. R10]